MSIGWMPKAMAELPTLVTKFTLPGPNHSRTIAKPVSGLFIWSAVTISMERPRTVPPTSAAAMRAATAHPSPVM